MNPLTSWQPHPDAWVLVVVLLAGYTYALAAWGPSATPGRAPATRRQRTSFYAGVALLWLGADWPVHHLADSLYSVHMLQHLLFSFGAAPLLLMGTPGWLLRRLLRPRAVRAVWKVATTPLIALLLYNGWVVAYHWPAMVNLSVSNDAAHAAMHALWVVFALVMWWPVLSPLPELPHLSYPGRMVYLFGNSILPTVPASFLTFAHHPLYTAYELNALGVDVVVDQQIAGMLMKIGGGLFLWTIIAVLFFRWFAEEERGGPDLLYWNDLEPEIEHARSAPGAAPPTTP